MKNIKDIRYLRLFVFNMLCMLFAACSTDGDAVGKERYVNLTFTVSLTDGVARAVPDKEQMQQLRILIVRPDGTIEYNRMVESLNSGSKYTTEDILVVANETKKIYLFANAEGLGINFDNIAIPALDTWVLNKDYSQQTTIPMSMMHEVQVYEDDLVLDNPLYIVRTACKVSITVTNQSSKQIDVDRLNFKSVSDCSYLLPQIKDEDWLANMVEDAKTDDKDENDGFITWISNYDLPDNAVHSPLTDDNWKVTLAVNGVSEEQVYYIHESKVDSQTYTCSVHIDGLASVEVPLPHLKSLVRNTHVKINAVVKDKEINWIATVCPYGSYKLEPGFGLGETNTEK